MKHLLAFLLPMMIGLSANSQTYGNEWIDYSKTYYKFHTEENALHRVDYNALVSGGIANPVGADLQVFTAGAQIPIYVSNNASFGPGDYIEFIGNSNDGKFDTQLYATSLDQSHDLVSLFTDEAAYYITLAPGGNNLRYQAATNDLSNLPPVEEFFMHEATNVPFNVHHRGEPKTDVGPAKTWLADFDKGEGYTGPSVTSNATQFLRFSTSNQYSGSAIPINVKMNIVGRDESIGAFLDQHVKMYIRSYDEANPTSFPADLEDQFEEYDIKRYEFSIPQSQLGAVATDVTLEALDGFEGVFPYESDFAATFGSISYPHTFNFENESSFSFNVVVNSDKYFEIENFDGGLAPVLLDRTSNQRYALNLSGGTYQVKIPFDPAFPGEHEFYISSTASTELVSVTGAEFTSRNFIDYSDPANQGDYIMIYHKDLTQGTSVNYVEEFRKYRQHDLSTQSGHSSPVNTFNAVTVEIEQLYDQFAQGIQKHPLSIKNFVNYILNGPNAWQNTPEHLFLVGKSIGYPDFRSNDTNFNKCLVPTFGHQASDVKLSTNGLDDYRPQLGTGRIPVSNGDEVRVYLEKLIAYEQVFADAENDCSLPARKQMKEVMLMTKGWSQGETQSFQQYTAGYSQAVQANNTGWNIVQDLVDAADHDPGPVRPELTAAINDGLAMIIYTGHGNGQYWQFNGHFFDGPNTLGPSNFNNLGKYPFILSNTSFLGQIHRPGGEAMSQEYVLYEGGGSIGFLAFVEIGYASNLDIFSSQFVDNLSGPLYGSTVGQLIKQTIEDVYTPGNSAVKSTCLSFTYAGDPAVELYNFDKPSYELESVTELSSGMAANDILVGLHNTGRSIPGQQVEIQITSTNSAGVSTVHPIQSVLAPFYYSQYNFSVPHNGEAGSFTYSVLIDPNNLIEEDCETGNSVSFSGKIYLEGYTNNGTMSTSLESSNLLPFAQPYSASPYNYPGTETVSSFPTGTVDWVLLELRSASDESVVVDRKAGFVRNDGVITDLNGFGAIGFDAPDGSYFVVLHHRGHVSIMSANPLTLPSSGLNDFTLSASSVKGNSQLALVGGTYAMRAGDFNGSGTVNFQDFIMWLQNNNTLNAYLSVDVDGNGTVNFSDFILWLTNNNHLTYPGI